MRSKMEPNMTIHWLHDCEAMIPEYQAIIQRMTSTLVRSIHKGKETMPISKVQAPLLEAAEQIKTKQAKKHPSVWQQQNGCQFWDCMGHVHPELIKALTQMEQEPTSEIKPQQIIQRMQQEVATHIQNILAKCKKSQNAQCAKNNCQKI